MSGLALLPEGWCVASLSEVVTINPKHKDLEDQTAGFIPMALAPTDFKSPLRYEERRWDQIKKGYTHFSIGDVIFAKVTPCFENGKAAIVKDIPNGIGAGSTEFYVLRPANENISVNYIFSVVKSHEFLQMGAANMTGAVGLRRVPKKFVEEFKINLPPLAEQKVIADKLDELLAQVECTQARLDAIPAILKAFRQSVLAAAVSGKLTEQWRGENEYNDSQYQDSWEWSGVPASWSVKLYHELADSRLGKMLDKSKNAGLPTNYLGNINVRWFNFKIDNLQQMLITEKERLDLSLQYNDVLICEGGEPGRCAIWKFRNNESIIYQKALHRARVNKKILP